MTYLNYSHFSYIKKLCKFYKFLQKKYGFSVLLDICCPCQNWILFVQYLARANKPYPNYFFSLLNPNNPLFSAQAICEPRSISSPLHIHFIHQKVSL